MNASLSVSLSRPSDVRVIRALRLAGDLTLAQAKVIAQVLEEHGEIRLADGLHPKSAEHLSEALAEAGLACTVTESNVDMPMLLFPGLNDKFVWSALRTIKKV